MSSPIFFSYHNYFLISILLTALNVSILVLLVILCNNCKKRRNQCSIVNSTNSKAENNVIPFSSSNNGNIIISFKPSSFSLVPSDNNSSKIKSLTINRYALIYLKGFLSKNKQDHLDQLTSLHLVFNYLFTIIFFNLFYFLFLRALPDIPTSSSNQQTHTNETVQSNPPTAKAKLKRSNKKRAPLPPATNPISTFKPDTSSADQDQENSNHHSYARIKDIIDSSTENDTDDYCDPHTCTTISNVSIKAKEDAISNVNSSNVLNSDAGANDLPSTSTSFAERALSTEVSYMTPPAAACTLNRNSSNSSIDIMDMSKLGEVSYNKISVREPLSKVLAERAVLEHHYTEVDEERISSFYEEIAGSANSSVTYTKIGDLSQRNSNPMNNTVININQPPIPPSVESLLVVAEHSRSTSPLGASLTSDQRTLKTSSNLVDNQVKDIYAFVDKSSKNRKNNPESKNLDELYAKVKKSGNPSANVISNRVNIIQVEHDPNQLPLTSNSKIINSEHKSSRPYSSDNHSPTPPPPPSLLNMPSRSSRTISLYDESFQSSNNSSHQRRHSSGTVSLKFHEYNNQNAIEEPGYEVVGLGNSDPDIDPGYEKIRKDFNPNTQSNHDNQLNLEEDAIPEPGYEVVKYEPESEPCYEVINKGETSSQNNDIIEPNYESIQISTTIRQGLLNTNYNNSVRINRHESDVSTEPGYERVCFVRRNISESGSDPAYASINEPDYDTQDILVERL